MTTTDDLHQRIDELTERVTALEGARRSDEPEGTTSTGTTSTDAFWALTGLQGRLSGDRTTAAGAVMIVGSLDLPTGEPIAWQEGVGTEGLFDSEWSDRSEALAAFGHPVRIELLRQLLSGVRTTAELAESSSLGTTGQLHHHLRQLKAAGWVQQAGRGSYEVPAARVVPLLATILAGRR